ncbi:hypothetical protein EDEG_00918 [Edhazardia aedis USNM 41457]|uniref:Uncharacterized protein n=1 Tax=Edhazardia aedis (strain USNM 41457) TaxID=1003232 RepID=J8ZZ25_EDHAE|nr:hypothetical protein EDEG_00918 [Edhazardia aedis USNM 41457]|eukprot:EJW04943.1 hypothetical protein EDEG_00918 [Edhazardia aedis USNM 41457]
MSRVEKPEFYSEFFLVLEMFKNQLNLIILINTTYQVQNQPSKKDGLLSPFIQSEIYIFHFFFEKKIFNKYHLRKMALKFMKNIINCCESIGNHIQTFLSDPKKLYKNINSVWTNIDINLDLIIENVKNFLKYLNYNSHEDSLFFENQENVVIYLKIFKEHINEILSHLKEINAHKEIENKSCYMHILMHNTNIMYKLFIFMFNSFNLESSKLDQTTLRILIGQQKIIVKEFESCEKRLNSFVTYLCSALLVLNDDILFKQAQITQYTLEWFKSHYELYLEYINNTPNTDQNIQFVKNRNLLNFYYNFYISKIKILDDLSKKNDSSLLLKCAKAENEHLRLVHRMSFLNFIPPKCTNKEQFLAKVFYENHNEQFRTYLSNIKKLKFFERKKLKFSKRKKLTSKRLTH